MFHLLKSKKKKLIFENYILMVKQQFILSKNNNCIGTVSLNKFKSIFLFKTLEKINPKQYGLDNKSG